MYWSVDIFGFSNKNDVILELVSAVMGYSAWRKEEEDRDAKAVEKGGSVGTHLERESLVAYIFGAEAVLNKKRALLEKPWWFSGSP